MFHIQKIAAGIVILAFVGLVVFVLKTSPAEAPVTNEEIPVSKSSMPTSGGPQESLLEDVTEIFSGEQIEIYEGITKSTSVTEINLSGQNLSGSLKAEIRHFKNLNVLNLSGNNFTGLPAEVGQLQKLEVLNLSNNSFTGLPYEVGNLPNLKVLDLRGNDYAEADLKIIREKLPPETTVLTD